MKALSVKQPWAWAIMHAGKMIENRPRRTHLREVIAIHASLAPARGWEPWYPPRAPKVPPSEKWVLGAILGFVEIVDCVEEHRSKWFLGPFGYVLANPRPLRKPVACKGALGFWTVPPETLRRCRLA
jgi:hypothetical protein